MSRKYNVRTPPERFWPKVNFSGPVSKHRPELGACWLWQGAEIPSGYGYFRGATCNVPVHRWSYEFCVGPIPKGQEIDHLCRVRNCVNPDHLESVIHHINIIRGSTRKGHHKSSCKNGHLFNQDNTAIRRDGTYACKTCARRWSTLHRAKVHT